MVPTIFYAGKRFLGFPSDLARLLLSKFKGQCRIFLPVFVLVWSGRAEAQDKPAVKDSVKDIYELSLEQLWNAPIGIASKKLQVQEEAPSIVTVISSEEIQKYGYRDLADALRMVPGFEFGIDVVGIFGLGFRGIWAHEGKALVMINGMLINCFGFGNVNYFGTYPIALVDRIEIIRGPGSAIHGSFSEVAVINVITKSGKILDGAELKGSVGTMNGTPLTNGTISSGLATGSMNLSATVTTNYTPVSTSTYNDFFGGTLKMGGENSWRKFTGIYITGGTKGLRYSYNRSYTDYLAQDGFVTVLPKSNAGINTNEVNNIMQSFNVQYDLKIRNNVSITPKFDVASGNPITTALSPNFANGPSGPQFFGPVDPWQNQSGVGSRFQAEMEMQGKVSTRTSVDGGFGYQYNLVKSVTVNGNPGLQISGNPADTVSAHGKGTEYAYIQYSTQGNNIGFTVGGRYEITPFGQAFAPRTGITFMKSNFNAKLLYGRAFRVPLFWQAYSRQFTRLDLPDLKPEFSNSYEIELGYKFTPHTKLSANVFYIDITSPIVYLGSNNSYQNYGRIQSFGMESEFQVKFQDYKGFVNFSYATPGGQTSRNFLNGPKDAFLALPTVKGNIGFYYTKGRFSFSPSATYLGKRYGQSQFSAQNSTITMIIYQTTVYNPLLLLNANFIVSVAKAVQFNFTIGNLLNTKYITIQPYYGGHAPMPAYNQQFSLGLKVKL